MNTEVRRDDSTPPKQECECPNGTERTKARKVYVPAVDIVESEQALMLVSDMPGVDDTGVDITIEKNVLTIKGAINEHVPDGFKQCFEEYGLGDYERSFTLPNEIDREAVHAVMKDGVLRLTLPKIKQAATRKVAVNAG